MAELEVTTQRGLNHRRLVEENRELQGQLSSFKSFADIVATSPQMLKGAGNDPQSCFQRL